MTLHDCGREVWAFRTLLLCTLRRRLPPFAFLAALILVGSDAVLGIKFTRELSRRFPTGEFAWCSMQFADNVDHLGNDNPNGLGTSFIAPPLGKVRITFSFDTSKGTAPSPHRIDEVVVLTRDAYESIADETTCFDSANTSLPILAHDVPGAPPQAFFHDGFEGDIRPEWEIPAVDLDQGLEGYSVNGICPPGVHPAQAPVFLVSDSAQFGTGSLNFGRNSGSGDGTLEATLPLSGLSPGVEYVVAGYWSACTADFLPAPASLRVTIDTDLGPEKVSYPGFGFGEIPDGGSLPTPGPPLDVQFDVGGVMGKLVAVDVDVTLFHDRAGDLDLTLLSPGGERSLVLVSRVGATSPGDSGYDSNFLGVYRFSDVASGPNLWLAAVIIGICNSGENFCVIPPGHYRTTAAGGTGQSNPAPFTSLESSFAGLSPHDVNGSWTLRVRDVASGFAGTVSDANLRLTTSLGAFDIDGNGWFDPLTDGILILRSLFGFTGQTLTAGAVGVGCTRCTAAEIEAFIRGVL